MDRRGFFRIVGVSGAAAAAAGCGKTTEAILPYVIPAEHIVPGAATWFATVCRECSAGRRAPAESCEGRIVKVEGNPDHPVHRGALCATGQASLLSTYDPDRIPGPRAAGRRRAGARCPSPTRRRSSWRRLAAARQAGAGRIAMVTQLETVVLRPPRGRLAQGGRRAAPASPTRRSRTRTFCAASQAAFGIDSIPQYAFEDARTFLSARCGLPRDLDIPRWSTPAVSGAYTLSARVTPRRTSCRAPVLDDRGERRRVGGEPSPVPRRRLRLPCCGSSSRPSRSRPCRRRRPEALTAVARDGGDRGRREAERRARRQAEAPGGDPREGSAEPGRLGSGVATSGVGVRRRGCGEPAELRPRERRPDRALRAQLGPFDGRAVTRTSLALTKAHGAGRDCRADREGREPRVHAPGARRRSSRRTAKVPFVVSLSSHMDETARAGPPRHPRPDAARVPGGPLAAGRRVGTSRSRRWRRCRRSGLDESRRPGSAPAGGRAQRAPGWKAPETFPGVETKAAGDLLLDAGRALVPGIREDRLQGGHLRRSICGKPWRAMAKTAAPKATFEEFWEQRPPSGWGPRADVPAAKVAPPAPDLKVATPAPAPRGQRLRSRAPGCSVRALRRCRRSREGVAPRGARPDDPGGLRELGRDPRGDCACA